MQDALSHILFSNTSDNPDTADRTLEIKVNDGLADSNIVTTTIHVTAIDDLPFATADNVITNSGTGALNAFQIPTSALLANDLDRDNALSITSIPTDTGGDASLGSGVVTFIDTGGNGGSFNYTATGGVQTTNATVAISQDILGALDGSPANDILVAKPGAVTINGNAGDDIFIGNTGIANMNGGTPSQEATVVLGSANAL